MLDPLHAYELLREHFNYETVTEPETFKEFYTLNTERMNESLEKRPIMEIENGWIPESIQEVTTPEILAAYRLLREQQISKFLAVPRWDQWGPLWQFLVDIERGEVPSSVQTLSEDDETVPESSSDIEETETSSVSIVSKQNPTAGGLPETYPTGIAGKDRLWGSRENAYLMLFFTILSTTGAIFKMPTEKQITNAFNGFFQSEDPGYEPRDHSAVASFYRNIKRTVRPIWAAATARATKNAEFLVPDITTDDLDSYIAEQSQ